MTNKKIDIWLRFTLYMIPIFVIVGYFIFNKGVGGNTQPSNILSNMNSLFTDIGNSSLVSPFFTWFKNNIIDTKLTNYVFLYSFYVLFVEIALLIKNVLLFVIRVANQMIERGVEIGK